MTIKKTVTDRVVQASRENGKKNKTGPRNTTKTRFNALKNGFLARKVIFRNESDHREFNALLASLTRYHRPVGPTERTLVCEVALSSWRWQGVYGWESLEMSRRENESANILQAIGGTVNSFDLPLSGITPEGWEPREITVRAGTRNREEEKSSGGEGTDKTAQTIVEAKMSAPLELILRYGAAIRRDYYRALTALLQLQQERLELEQLTPATQRRKTA